MDHPRVLLLHGDAYRCRKALDERHRALAELHPRIERWARFADEIDDAAMGLELRSSSLFDDARHFVIRGAERLGSPALLVDAAAETPASGTYLTLIAAAPRPRSRLVKAVEAVGRVVGLPSPRGREIPRYAAEMLAAAGCPGSPALLREMVEQSGGDLMQLAQEARKLATFASGGAHGTDALLPGLLFAAGERAIWPMLDRLGERRVAAALRELGRLSEDPGRLLAAAARHLSRLAAARALAECGTPRAARAKLLGVADWLLRRLAGQAASWGAGELLAALQHAVALDVAVKDGECRAEDALLELVLSTTPLSP